MRPSRRQLPTFTRWGPSGQPSLTAIFVALSVAAATVQFLFTQLGHGEPLPQPSLPALLGLDADTVAEGHHWQFVTFALLHAGPWILLGNMLGLFFAGREVEGILGRQHFAGLYALGVFGGGAAQWAVMAAGWAPAGVPFTGVTGGVMALLAAFATILPELEVTLMLGFVVPVRVRAKTVGVAVAVVAAGLWFSGVAPGLGPAAMLAGALAGWLYVKQLGYGSPLAIQRYLFEKRQRAARIERMPAAQFISQEIDPILDKIAREGMHSLTRAERRILEKGREKIAARTAARVR